MIEHLELRVRERLAAGIFSPGEGERLGAAVRRVRIRTDDPRVSEIAKSQAELSKRGESLFAGWSLQREYTQAELEASLLFRAQAITAFEPAGEECGTVYDDSDVCAACGAGRRQVSSLRLDLRKLPKRVDFARTIADEWVVSQRAAEFLVRDGLRGFELRPVEHAAIRRLDPVDLSAVPAGQALLSQAQQEGLEPGTWQFLVWLNRPEHAAQFRRASIEMRRSAKIPDGSAARVPTWYQLKVVSERVDVAAGTHFGIDPFNDDDCKEYVCPLGHTLGLNVLSELVMTDRLPVDIDIALSRQHVGVRRGLLVPTPFVLTSRRFAALVQSTGLRGLEFERVYVEREAGQVTGLERRNRMRL